MLTFSLARAAHCRLLPPLGEGGDGGLARALMPIGPAPTPTLPQRGREKEVIKRASTLRKQLLI